MSILGLIGETAKINSDNQSFVSAMAKGMSERAAGIRGQFCGRGFRLIDVKKRKYSPFCLRCAMEGAKKTAVFTHFKRYACPRGIRKRKVLIPLAKKTPAKKIKTLEILYPSTSEKGERGYICAFSHLRMNITASLPTTAGPTPSHSSPFARSKFA